jgi:hypothetical protein
VSTGRHHCDAGPNDRVEREPRSEGTKAPGSDADGRSARTRGYVPLELIAPNVEGAVENAEDIDVSIFLEQVCDPILLVKKDTNVPR